MFERVQDISTGLNQTQPASWQVCLAEMLELAGQIYGREILPGEARIWQELLKGKSARAIEEGFQRHFSVSKFFPRPADILEVMAERAETAYVENNGYLAAGPVRGYLESGKEKLTFGSIIAKFKEMVGKEPVKPIPPSPKEVRQMTDVELADRKMILEQQKRTIWARRQLEKARKSDETK